MKKQDSKQRLFEVMQRLDKTFKPKLNENFDFENNDEIPDPVKDANDAYVSPFEKTYNSDAWVDAQRDAEDLDVETEGLNEGEHDLTDVAYVISPYNDFREWTIYFKKSGNVTGHLSGYSKDNLIKKLNELNVNPSEVPALFAGNLNIGFILTYTNVDVEGHNEFQGHNISNEQYIEGMKTNGAQLVDLQSNDVEIT